MKPGYRPGTLLVGGVGDLMRIAVVMLATWVVVQTEVDLRQRPGVVQFGHK